MAFGNPDKFIVERNGTRYALAVGALMTTAIGQHPAPDANAKRGGKAYAGWNQGVAAVAVMLARKQGGQPMEYHPADDTGPARYELTTWEAVFAYWHSRQYASQYLARQAPTTPGNGPSLADTLASLGL